MKRIKNLLLAFGGLLSMASIVTPILSTSAETNTVSNMDSEIKINENNSFTISNVEYEILRDFYKPYYDKLGLKYHLDQYSEGDSLDKDNPYNKVGIIDLQPSDFSYLPSKLKGFNIEIDPIIKNQLPNEYDGHGSTVASIIGTDTGINKKAHIYYSAIQPYGYEHYEEAFKYMRDQNVKLVNFSFSNIKPWKYWWNFIDNSDFNKEINVEIERKLGKWIDGNYNDSISYKDKWDFSKEIDDKKIYEYINNNHIDIIPLIENLLYSLMIINHQELYNNFLNMTKEINNSFEKYANKYGMKFVVSAGNDNFLWNSIQKFRYIFSNDYDSFKDLIIYLYQKSSNINTNVPTDTFNDRAKIQLGIKYIAYNADKLSKLFVKSATDDGQNFLDNILQLEENIFSLKNSRNVIYVGAVNYNNEPAKFSEYSITNNEVLPFVSAYGEYSDTDDAYIKEKLGAKNTRNYKYNLFSNSLWKNGLDSNAFLEKKYIDFSPKEKLSFLVQKMKEFNGTSMAAPMITGLISLLQTEYHKNFSISEIKTLLSASSTYANTHATILKGVDSNTRVENWRENRSKSKTGFGIPKYFKIKKFLDNNELKHFKNNDNAYSKYGKFLLHEENKKIKTEQNIKKIRITASFIAIPTKNIIEEHMFYSCLRDQSNFEKIRTFTAMYNSALNNPGLKAKISEIYNNDRNILDAFSISYFDSNSQRLKESKSIDSSTERLNFGYFKTNEVENELYYIPLQLERILQILDICYKEDDVLNPHHYSRDKIAEDLRYSYTLFATKYMDMTYIMEVE
ncbi:S8 family serine peptidase [Mycoplasma sp. Sp33II]|uniref:S8 family serine peptidase n=1 Tax=unclassified Mycoplasma TaxID=2683645 RepID=UPI003AAE027C